MLPFQRKFEKGLDPDNAMKAIDRACQLVEELGAGEVVGGAVDIYPVKKEPVVIPYDAGKINALLGTDISEEEMLKAIKSDDEAVFIKLVSLNRQGYELAEIMKKLNLVREDIERLGHKLEKYMNEYID